MCIPPGINLQVVSMAKVLTETRLLTWLLLEDHAEAQENSRQSERFRLLFPMSRLDS